MFAEAFGSPESSLSQRSAKWTEQVLDVTGRNEFA
jgi:hypothetical protein